MPKKNISTDSVVYTLRLPEADKAWLDEQSRLTGWEVQHIVRCAIETLRSSVEYNKGRLILPVNIPKIVENEINLERRLVEAFEKGKVEGSQTKENKRRSA